MEFGGGLSDFTILNTLMLLVYILYISFVHGRQNSKINSRFYGFYAEAPILANSKWP
jgi:hypothetical protein